MNLCYAPGSSWYDKILTTLSNLSIRLIRFFFLRIYFELQIMQIVLAKKKT